MLAFPRPVAIAAIFMGLSLSLLGCKPDADNGLGADPSVPAGPGEARAGVVRDGVDGEAALFGGVSAEGKAGDLKIYNHLVQFIIQGAYRSHGYVDVGGFIIDADLVRDDGTLGRDTIDDLFLGFGTGRLFHASSVEVVADGSEGPAIVRTRGKDVAWEFIQGVLEASAPLLPELYLEVVNDFELAPDSYSLKVTTTFTNKGPSDISFSPTDGYMISGEDMYGWAPGKGLTSGGTLDLPAIGTAGKWGEAALTLWPDSGTIHSLGIEQLVDSAGIVAIGHPQMDLAQGESATLLRYWTVAPDILTAEAQRLTHQGKTLARLSGRVTDSDSGEGVPGVRLHLVLDDGNETVLGYVATDRGGNYDVEVTPGDYLVYATGQTPNEWVELPAGSGRYAPFGAPTVNGAALDAMAGSSSPPPLPMAMGRPSPAAATVSLSDGDSKTLDLQMDPPGHLSLDIQDDSGAPLPAVVELDWSAGGPPVSTIPPTLRDAFGLPGLSSRAGWAWTSNGSVELDLLPGDYDLVINHSMRHERATINNVAVSGGATASESAVLEETLPHDGWLSLDGHLHSAPSSDGSLPMAHRVIACAATGVDLPVTTDHDRQADYRPIASALGLDDRMLIVPGVEVSPVLRGHHNLYPIEPDPLGPINGGAYPWWQGVTNTEDMYAGMRAGATDRTLIQVNHGRSPGMFSIASFDPNTGEVGRESHFSWDFDAMELMNGGSRSDVEPLKADFFAFLNMGKRVIPTGTSDSHSRRSACGLARTDVFVDSLSPADVDVQTVRDAMAAGHVIVASGITLRVTFDDGVALSLPGDTVIGAGDLHVRVQAPSWMAPSVVRLYENGVLVFEEALTTADADGTWYDALWPVAPSEDAWYAVEVDGNQALGQTFGGAVTYALSNGIFVDVNGDGWTPPGL